MVRNLLAALLAAILALACSAEGNTASTPTDKVDVVETPETEVATLAIEIRGQPADAPVSRRLSPPIDTPNVVLIKDNDGSNIDWVWINGLVTAKVPIGTYTCEVTFDGFLAETITIQVDSADIGTTVTQLIELDTNGPTKPEPVNLGEYSVERINTDDKYEPLGGMWSLQKYKARVIFTPSFGDTLAQFQLQGELPQFTCTASGDDLACEQWTDVDGTLANATGTVAPGNEAIELQVEFISYAGTAKEDHDFERFRLIRLE